MTKAEIISRIIDRITDPWNDSPEDYEDVTPIDIIQATYYLAEYRHEDAENDFNPDDRMPAEATPALYMEAFNCYVRFQKHELRVIRLAEYITENEMVCEYDQYKDDYLANPLKVVPTDWLYTESFPFDMIDDAYPNTMFLITLGQRSPKFNPNHEYCWFDKKAELLFSSDTPFADGVLDAKAFARFILLDADALRYFVDSIIDDDDIPQIFGCTHDELMKEVNY